MEGGGNVKNPFRYVPQDHDVFTPMPVKPEGNERVTSDEVVRDLDENIDALCAMLHMPPNVDVTIRRVSAGGHAAAVVGMEGMVSRDVISDFILRPLLRDEGLAKLKRDELLEHVASQTLSTVTLLMLEDMGAVCKNILNGSCALLLDGCDKVLCMDVRQYEKRNIEKTQVENVILGPHEAFTESLRTNITQVRRLIRTGELVTEFFEVGNKAPTTVALIYLADITNPDLVEEGRRRLRAVDYDFVPGSGYLQHLIEDSPSALPSQMIQTERPDRTAFFLMEGHIAILCDNSPFSLCAPTTLWHIMHTSDDTFMRWPSGSFIRIIRFSGMFLSLLMPALYLATILYHSEILPMELLSSIAAANAKVPFPMLLEVLLMELSFDLINEAGTRVPGMLGSALGIIGAIILGQAAVAASIVSPILIIIVAVTGLGNFAIPDYSFSLSLRMLRLGLIVIAALLGYLGICIAFFLILSMASTLNSFGVPWLSPFAPKSTSDGDLIGRSPLWNLRRRPAFLRTKDAKRVQNGKARAWDKPERKL
jgi:spore germination protein KA